MWEMILMFISVILILASSTSLIIKFKRSINKYFDKECSAQEPVMRECSAQYPIEYECPTVFTDNKPPCRVCEECLKCPECPKTRNIKQITGKLDNSNNIYDEFGIEESKQPDVANEREIQTDNPY